MQSTTLLLLSCHGDIPRFDYALFSDTGWEPAAVYRHLARLSAYAALHGIPVHRVTAGNIRADALNPVHRFASMPLHVRNPDGSKGLGRRQCTGQYKISPLKAATRRLLGYPHPTRVPDGVYAEQAIGISLDEIHRAKDADMRYLRHVFPLLDLRWRREDCRAYLTEHGFGDTPRSACVGCPFHSQAEWRHLRDTDPQGWADAVDFDAAIRHGHPSANRRGQPQRRTNYLHSSCRPLSEANLEPRRATRDTSDSEGGGCSPWGCPSGATAEAVDNPQEAA